MRSAHVVEAIERPALGDFQDDALGDARERRFGVVEFGIGELAAVHVHEQRHALWRGAHELSDAAADPPSPSG